MVYARPLEPLETPLVPVPSLPRDTPPFRCAPSARTSRPSGAVTSNASVVPLFSSLSHSEHRWSASTLITRGLITHIGFQCKAPRGILECFVKQTISEPRLYFDDGHLHRALLFLRGEVHAVELLHTKAAELHLVRIARRTQVGEGGEQALLLVRKRAQVGDVRSAVHERLRHDLEDEPAGYTRTGAQQLKLVQSHSESEIRGGYLRVLAARKL